MRYYIKKGDKYVTEVEVTGNGVVTYYLVNTIMDVQDFTELEADMFLAMVRRSTILSSKEKKGYRAITGEQLLVEMFGKLPSETQKGKWKVQYNAESAGDAENNS